MSELRDQLGTTALIAMLASQHEPNSGNLAVDIADALLPVVQAAIAEGAAQALDQAMLEDRTTVAKLSPVERLTCYLVKGEDLVVRAAALRAQT